MQDVLKDAIENLGNKASIVNDADVNRVAAAFLAENPGQVSYFCKTAYGTVNDVSLAAARAILLEELRNATISFVNSGYHQTRLESIKSYLHATVVRGAKRLANQDKRNVPICPGCKFNDKITVVELRDKEYYCSHCQNEAATSESEEIANLHKAFALHSRKGFRCPECSRFIPKTNISVLTCPYPDCFFTGHASDTEVMRHPTIKGSVEDTVLHSSSRNDGENNHTLQDFVDEGGGFANRGWGHTSSTGSSLHVQEHMQEDYDVLMRTLREQRSLLAYQSNDSTMLQKTLMYDAYENTIKRYPEEMVGYLVHETRNGGLQHKIFQEYVRLLEAKIPFTFTRNGKKYEVTSLLDSNLSVFDGESTFKTKVNQNNEIDNKTDEFYIGGRKGFYCRAYYIGKLVEVTDMSGTSLMGEVLEYSFFKIKMKETVRPGTEVTVKHLRIPPHYQMGGMVYLNRIRRKIVDKVYLTLHSKKREPRR